jgi:hypothetical protein
MPKRVIDFEAMWSSDKIDACPEWAQAEYAWIYGLADANGSFEVTNLRVPYSKVAPIRKNLSFERFEQTIGEFNDKGLLFLWTENGKRYGHWTNSDRPGRLPQPARRGPRYGPILAPQVPKSELQAYMTRGLTRCDGESVACDAGPVVGLGLGLGMGMGENLLGGSTTHVCDKRTPGVPVAGGFERFYLAYPRKKGRAEAQQAWRKVNPEEVDAIFARLEILKLGEWKGKDLQYIPYPGSWLNGRRWEDEIEAGGSNGITGRTRAGAVPATPGKYDAVQMVRASNIR